MVNNKILIIKGILAEKCGIDSDLYDELSDLLDDIKILNNAKDSALKSLNSIVSSTWINVNDKLPQHDNNVLAILDGRVCIMAYMPYKEDGEIKKLGHILMTE